jgi:hypothetical protein
MKAQKTINIETLIPSSLLDEEHSDNESFSNCKFEDNLPLFKDAPKEKLTDKVNHIFNNFIIFYRMKKKIIQKKKILIKIQIGNRTNLIKIIFLMIHKSLQ